MALYQIIVRYDGTDFFGYQRQEMFRTVQGEIEDALSELGWTGETILSLGRTDTGVHAEGQTAVFNLEWKHLDDDLKKAINANLPDDVAVSSVSRVEDGFHPRFDAKHRKYRYQVYFSPMRDPFLDRFNWRVWPKPNIKLMNEAAKVFLGSHDFHLYGKPYKIGGRTERKVASAEWISEKKNQVFFYIRANSFLYHMVRRMVYLLIRVGQQKVTFEMLKESFEGIDNLPPGIAPANGLFLEEILY